MKLSEGKIHELKEQIDYYQKEIYKMQQDNTLLMEEADHTRKIVGSYNFLREVILYIGNITEYDSLLSTICDAILGFGVSEVFIILHENEDDYSFMERGLSNELIEELRKSNDYKIIYDLVENVAECCSENNNLIISDIAKTNGQNILGYTSGSILISKLERNNQKNGYICFRHYEPDFFEPTIIDTLNILIPPLNIFVENSILLKKNIEMANKDNLTGIYNRNRLEKYTYENQYSENLTAVISFDVDRFKHVNDTYGHAQGDKVLKYLGMLLNDNYRKSNNHMVPFRVGGDEFVVMCENLDKLSIISFVKEISSHFVEKFGYLSPAQEDKKIGLSIGVFYKDNFKSQFALSEKIKLSDEALYISKENGRNRYTIPNAVDIVRHRLQSIVESERNRYLRRGSGNDFKNSLWYSEIYLRSDKILTSKDIALLEKSKRKVDHMVYLDDIIGMVLLDINKEKFSVEAVIERIKNNIDFDMSLIEM